MTGELISALPAQEITLHLSPKAQKMRGPYARKQDVTEAVTGSRACSTHG